MYTPTHTTTNPDECDSCGACGGKGYQRNLVTGINETCPICHGTGWVFTGRYTMTM